MKKLFVILTTTIAISIISLTSPPALAKPIYDADNQRGCCSYHGGVCGCIGTREKCCDGTLSPTCTC